MYAPPTRAVAEGLDRALRSTADPNKRKLLERAASRAFDPEIYEAGLTLVLLERLGRLTYGDVAYLRRALEKEERHKKASATAPGDRLSPEDQPLAPANKATLEAFHQEQLASAGLVWIPGSQMFVTELGKRMLALLCAPEQKKAQEASKP
jgi:hypothetical protein